MFLWRQSNLVKSNSWYLYWCQHDIAILNENNNFILTIRLEPYAREKIYVLTCTFKAIVFRKLCNWSTQQSQYRKLILAPVLCDVYDISVFCKVRFRIHFRCSISVCIIIIIINWNIENHLTQVICEFSVTKSRIYRNMSQNLYTFIYR